MREPNLKWEETRWHGRRAWVTTYRAPRGLRILTAILDPGTGRFDAWVDEQNRPVTVQFAAWSLEGIKTQANLWVQSDLGDFPTEAAAFRAGGRVS